MNIGDMASAVRMHRRWHNQARSQKVAELHTYMIVAVPESWQFQDTGIVCPLGTKHLCEDRVGHRDVQPLGAGIRDTEPHIVFRSEIVVEALEERLTCRCIDRCVVHLLPDPFHKDL